MNKISAILFLVVVPALIKAEPIPVQIATSSNGSVQLLRGGAPYIVKGVGGFANPALAAVCGANSIRTWGTENAQANLDTAHTHGLTVNLGIWLPHDGNYNDIAFRNSWKTAVTNLANTYKNHPALLVWSLGNELNIPANYTGTWTLLQELAAIIKSIDPNHPVMTVLAGAPTSVLNTLATTCPSIDLVGFNVYAGIDGVPAAVAAATGWTKPYMITEWGPNGHWESANTSWGRPIEAHSSSKAALYSSRAALIDSWRPRCLGSYVFFWDQKQERTPTWYSMFLENRPLSGLAAQACPTVDSMAAFWNGSVPGNRAPVFHSATLNGSAAPASLQAAPGKMESITINATDPDGNLLTIVPEILKEPSQTGSLGSWEGRPEALGDNARATGNTITFTMPPAGQYRLFAYILDGQGKAATWNLPLLSTGTPLASAPQPFNALPKVIPGTIQAEEFDRGGLGISYSDTTAANLGGAFRNTAVDIEPCTDAGGGHNLGWLAPGEWLNYRISAASAVTVRPKLRVANLNTGGIVRLLLNGTNITGNLTIPATGGWQTFTDLQSPSNVSVAAGSHTLRLEVVANGPNNSAVGNINSIIFDSAGLQPPVVSYASWLGSIGLPFSAKISASNSPTSFAIAAGSLPPGLSLNTSNGSVTGVPSQTGIHTASVTASNSAGTSPAQTIAISIGGSSIPEITSSGNASGAVGSLFSFQVNATNSPTRYTASGLPAGLSINASTGLVGGIPALDGVFAAKVNAVNAVGTASKNMTFTIAATLPVIQNNGTVIPRLSIPFSLSINATNVPRSFGATGLPPGLSVNSTTGNINGIPSALGNFTATLSATNPAGTATKNLLFRVLPMPPAVSSPSSVSATCGVPVSHTVTATNSPTGFAASGLPAGLGINATSGVISGTPVASGNFISKITASNAGGVGSQNLSFSIAAAIPVVTNTATINASTGVFFSQPVKALYSPTSFSATGLPSGLSINATTGFITGIPTNFGSINATLRAANSAGTGSKQVVFKILPEDPVDVRHIRIRSAAGGYLRETANGATPSFENAPLDHDFRTHWTLEANPDRTGIRIRNRHSGLVLHIQPQDGVVRPGSLAANYTSTHWTLNGSSGNLTLGSLWQSGQFMAKGGNGTLVTGTAAGNSTASRFQIEDLPAGAAVPWTTYDETNAAAIVAPAHILSNSYNASFDINNRAAEASGQACILLNGFGTSARWTVLRAADALTLRYSVDDGVTGNITLKLTSVNGTVRTRKIPVTSAQAWVYFDSTGNEYNTTAAGRIPTKRYNEARIKLLPSDGGGVQAGDSIEFSREAGDAMVWIDLVEAETMAPVSAPVGFLNLKTSYGAVGDGTTIDTQAFRNAVAEAASLRKGLYIPSGTYRLDGEIILPPGTVLQGAGVWDTELLFSATGSEASGGIKGNGSNIAIRDFYIRGSQNSRTGGYKGLKGWWGTNSKIQNLWIEQTAVGAWIADLNTNLNVTDGLLIRNCRVRNTFADGINLAGGTKNSVVENCHIRGTGDDGLATWSSGKELGKPATSNQIFRYNTIQCVYRAGGIGLFGGSGHKVHHNLVEDQVAGPGIRANSVFQMVGGVNTGWPFGTVASVISENTLRRTGSVSLYSEKTAAVELQAWYGPVQALRFTSNRIDGTIHQAVRLNRTASIAGASFSNIQFENSQLSSVPAGVAVGAGSSGAVTVDTALSAAGTTNSSSALSLIVR